MRTSLYYTNTYTNKKAKWLSWAFVAFVIFGAIIAASDLFVLPIYLIFLPLHALFLYLSLKTKNLPCIIYCMFLFISHGIGSIPFYLNRENAERIGFSAIGNFDFSYKSLLYAYSYLFVFLVALLLFVAAFKRNYHSNFLTGFIRQQYNTVELKSKHSILPIALCSMLFSWISLQMYNMQIGMIGLKQTELPFHLTGVLFFARRFLFPIVLVWLYVKTKAKLPATIILIVYALFVGITGTSKSACLLVLIPMAFICFLTGKKTLAYLCAFFVIFSYIVIEDIRQIVFEAEASIPLVELLQMPWSTKDDVLFRFFLSFTNRFYGLKANVLPVQNYDLDFKSLVYYYMGTPITQVLPDFVYKLFGFNLPDDKAYGVGIGYTGSMTLLSCHNYFYTILQAFIIAILFVFQNDNIQRIMLKNGGRIYKYIALLILIASSMAFLDGVSMTGIYLSIIALVLIRYKMPIK